MDEQKTDPTAEITAMQKIAETLKDLNKESVARVLSWAADIYGIRGSTSKMRERSADAANARDDDSAGSNSIKRQFPDLASLYNAASPGIDADKALVAAYWFQFAEEQPDFVSQDVNAALKNLGHGVSNITDAFDNLMSKKPQLVMQVKKSGTSKQARKKYRVTAAGKTAVEQMIEQHQ
jgi:hypothetical protein